MKKVLMLLSIVIMISSCGVHHKTRNGYYPTTTKSYWFDGQGTKPTKNYIANKRGW